MSEASDGFDEITGQIADEATIMETASMIGMMWMKLTDQGIPADHATIITVAWLKCVLGYSEDDDE